MAGEPGHHLHQARRAAGHLRPPGRLGAVWVYDPLGLAGVPGPGGPPWPTASTYADARRIGRMLADAADVQGHKADDANYWQLLGAKLLSVLLFAAAGPAGRWPTSPAGWTSQDVDDVAQALMEIGNQQALDAWAACTSRPDNTMGTSTGRPRRCWTCRRPGDRRLGRGLRPGPGRAAHRREQHPLPVRAGLRAGAAPRRCSSSWSAW